MAWYPEALFAHALAHTYFAIVRPEFKDFSWTHRAVKAWVDKKPNPMKTRKQAEARVDAYVARGDIVSVVIQLTLSRQRTRQRSSRRSDVHGVPLEG
jgi:hypothetical protein